MGVGATSELFTVKQLLWSFCGGSGKTLTNWRRKWSLTFLQDLIPWAARCETKHETRRYLWVFDGKLFTLNFLRRKWQNWIFKEEVVFWIFQRKWVLEQQSVKLNTGVVVISEFSTGKQLLGSLCGGSGKTEFIEGGSGVLNFLQELIPWAARCETKHESRVGATSEFSTEKRLLWIFLRRKWQYWTF